MHPNDCPENWEFIDIPGHDVLVTSRTRDLYLQIIRQRFSREALGDPRGAHFRLFVGLSPARCPYFAGNYRGDPRWRCLEHYAVGVQGDPRVGWPPCVVLGGMREFAAHVEATLNALDHCATLPDTQLSSPDKLLNLIAAAASLMDLFLRIHPFANGNGHISRACLTAFLRRYGYRLRPSIHPRPDEPFFSLILAARDGNPEPLELHLLGLTEKINE